MEPIRDLELRFVADRDEATAVLAAASAHLRPEIYEPARPVSYYRTLYLDTAEERYLRSFDGATASRLRIRQYADATELGEPPRIASAAFLELKRTTGAERVKHRVELPAPGLGALLLGRPAATVEARLAEAPVFASIGEDLRRGRLLPCMLTWYRRLSLVGGPVRLTFDEAIAYCPPELPIKRGELAEPAGVLARGPRAVLEVKLRGEAPAWLRHELSALAPDPHHSKFRAGMSAQSPEGWRAASTLPLPVLA